MQRAPHPPKGFIPSEGWARGSQGHPWSPTDKPAAGRRPIARLPRPPTAPPFASAAAHRPLHGRQQPAAPPALGTGERGRPEGAWGTGHGGAGASRGTPPGCPNTGLPLPPRRPRPPHRRAAGPARPEHAQCWPRRRRLPSERRGGRRGRGMRWGGAGGVDSGATLGTSGKQGEGDAGWGGNGEEGGCLRGEMCVRGAGALRYRPAAVPLGHPESVAPGVGAAPGPGPAARTPSTPRPGSQAQLGACLGGHSLGGPPGTSL